MLASEIMQRANVLLLDDGYVRWPRTELADWINDGVKAIILAKPDAKSKGIFLNLAQGTRQKVPESIEGITPIQLLAVKSNVIDRDTRQFGRAIRATLRDQIDAHEPNWHNPSFVPYRKEVRQVVFDEGVPMEFYCYPGNDGHGIVDASVSYLPPPVVARANVSIDTDEAWQTPVGLPEPYSVPLIDFVLFKAFSKDDIAGDPTKAMTHYQTFATALGIKTQSQQAYNPNRSR